MTPAKTRRNDAPDLAALAPRPRPAPAGAGYGARGRPTPGDPLAWLAAELRDGGDEYEDDERQEIER